jgi:hypothetical protein
MDFAHSLNLLQSLSSRSNKSAKNIQLWRDCYEQLTAAGRAMNTNKEKKHRQDVLYCQSQTERYYPLAKQAHTSAVAQAMSSMQQQQLTCL